jgi:hypothetical protein
MSIEVSEEAGWTIEEKRAFIDSILQGFPVPIILLAVV